MRAKVCIVDDDEDILLSLENRVHSMGHDALQLIRKEEPDLVLTDLELPDLHGMELIKQAREYNPTCLLL
jgi:DNA-binding NtrC family response regulator